TYHVNQPLFGFGEGASDPAGWAQYHLVPTTLETAYRATKPTYQAPPVRGDNWVGSQPPTYGKGSAAPAPPHGHATAAQAPAADTTRSAAAPTDVVQTATGTVTGAATTLTGSLLRAGS